ncbi:MAG: hypothetical protein EBQ95_04415 [Gammaproteobacteria bacterium]|nr:hypothetical protein [Gammaproteobacteria bacterium]
MDMSPTIKKSILLSMVFIFHFSAWSAGLVLEQPPIIGIKDPYENIQVTCSSLIPTSPSENRRKFVKKWSAFVAKQAFALNYATVEFDIQQIKDCFSDTGWTNFKSALDHSGNIAMIKANLLTSTAQIIEPIAIQHIKDESRWEIDVPMQIVYQNDKKKMTQMISVHLNISELSNRQLSILQIMGNPIAQDSRALSIDPTLKTNEANHPISNTQPLISQPLSQDQAPSNLKPAVPPPAAKPLAPAQDPINLNAQDD